MQPQIEQHLSFVEGELGKTEWFAGSEFTAADIQMSFPVEAAAARGGLTASRPKTWPYVQRDPRAAGLQAGHRARRASRARPPRFFALSGCDADHIGHATSVLGALGVPKKPGNHDDCEGCHLLKSARTDGSQSDGNSREVPTVRASAG